MIPRFSVTSLTRVRPGSLRTLFSFSLPLRYSITSTVMPISLHSWNPASGPSVWPVPRSTRKLNCAYGRSRRTAISPSPDYGITRQPHQIIEGQLQLFEGDVVAHRVEARPRPPRRPRADPAPRVHHLAA